MAGPTPRPPETLSTDAQADVFSRQSEHFELLGSPVYARLAGRLAEDPRPASAILGDDASWDLGLRLFGAVHHHVLTGVAPSALSGDWDDFASALETHRGSLTDFVRTRGVQTNETQRCVALVPALLTVARATDLPLELIELGPSAGLNLVFDRYFYRYAEGTFGDPGARLSFDVLERGRVPASLLETPLTVRRRRGIDLSPIDLTSKNDVTLLHSFLWPGLTERERRLDAAIETFLTAPDQPELTRGDYVDLLPGILAERPADTLTVVYQTASTGYLTSERYDQLRRSIDAAGQTVARSRGYRRGAATRTRRRRGDWLGARDPGLARTGAAGRARRLPRQLARLARRVISSKDNPKLKLVRALQRKKERDETGLFACEGEDLCDAALEAGIEPVELLIAGETVEADFSPQCRRWLIRRARSASSGAATCRRARATPASPSGTSPTPAMSAR